MYECHMHPSPTLCVYRYVINARLKNPARIFTPQLSLLPSFPYYNLQLCNGACGACVLIMLAGGGLWSTTASIECG